MYKRKLQIKLFFSVKIMSKYWRVRTPFSIWLKTLTSPLVKRPLQVDRRLIVNY